MIGASAVVFGATAIMIFMVVNVNFMAVVVDNLLDE